MTTIIPDELKALLASIRSLQQANEPLVPHDYTTLKACVFQFELELEVCFLESILADASHFKQHFIERCRKRETNTVDGIPFHILPETPTNQLYWRVAELVFQPQTMRAMLELILPGTTAHLTLHFPQAPLGMGPVETKNYLRNMLPLVELSEGLQALTCPPLMQTLTHYVLSEKFLFDVRELEHFSLAQQAALEHILTEKYPGVAEKLYKNHNSNLRQLHLDILTYNSHIITPKAAIDELIHGLLRGGSRVTGNEFAAPCASDAIKRFFRYFNSLPDKTREQLRQLNAHGFDIASVIDDEIENGRCVETAANHLTYILNDNLREDILLQPPVISITDCKALEKHYGGWKNAIDTQKDSSFIAFFPADLIADILACIQIQSEEKLIDLMLNFSSEFYNTLYQHIIFENAANILDGLAITIKSGLFNPEQKKAVAIAMATHYQRFKLDQPILFWALKTEDIDLFIMILQFYPPSQRTWLVQQTNHKWTNVFRQVLQRPDYLQAILSSLTEDQCFDLLKPRYQDRGNIFHHTADCPESFKLIMTFYRKAQIFTALEQRDNSGRTVLHRVAKYPELLLLVLGYYSKKQQLIAVKQRDLNGNSLLHCAAKYSESLGLILEIYPPHQRLDALMRVDNYGRTAVHQLVNQSDSLKKIIQCLPVDQILNLIKSVIKKKNTSLLHHIVVFPTVFHEVLLRLPKEQILKELKFADINGVTPIHHAMKSPKSIKMIWQLLEKNEQIAILTQVYANAPTLLDTAIHHPAALNVIRQFIPKELWFSYLNKTDQDGCTVLFCTLSFPYLMKSMLNSLSGKEILQVLGVKDKKGKTLLHYAMEKTELMGCLLQAVPDEQRLSVLKLTDTEGNSILHYAFNSPELFAVIQPLIPEQSVEIRGEIKNKIERLIHACQLYKQKITLDSSLMNETLLRSHCSLLDNLLTILEGKSNVVRSELMRLEEFIDKYQRIKYVFEQGTAQSSTIFLQQVPKAWSTDFAASWGSIWNERRDVPASEPLSLSNTL